MTTVQEAKQQVASHAFPLGTEQRAVSESLGYVLAEDVFSDISLPPFRQSSMDGYVVHHEDLTQPDTLLTITAQIKAGDSIPQRLEKGTASRIFTGAPVPEGATAVIMQEKTTRVSDQLTVHEFPIKVGQNIRAIGQQILQGELALPTGSLVTPGAIGFLLGLNCTSITVYRKPKVGLLVTGDELATPGSTLEHGQIYESNSYLLEAALRQEGITDITIRFVKDDAALTKEAITELKKENDIVIATGGVSVGDFDFVGKAMEEVGVKTIFYKVRQRPGKPLFFGKSDDKLFFGLPGNPAASLVCFYEYVLPAIRKMSGRSDCNLPILQLPITSNYSFAGERDEFVKATATSTEVTPLEGQESFILRSFAISNALIYLPSGRNQVKSRELVEVHLLPFFC